MRVIKWMGFVVLFGLSFFLIAPGVRSEIVGSYAFSPLMAGLAAASLFGAMMIYSTMPSRAEKLVLAAIAAILLFGYANVLWLILPMIGVKFG